MSKYAVNTNHLFLGLPNNTVFRYNLNDVYYTAHLYFAERRELADPSLQNAKYFDEWVEPLQVAVVNMQRRGLAVDRATHARYAGQVSAELSEMDSLVRCYADGLGMPGFNPNSGPQVARLLFEECGLKPGRKTDTGQNSVDQESLTRVLRGLRKKDEQHRPLLHWLFHRSRLQTIKERYLALPVDPDGRVRPKVKITGTKTFRYAYAEPALQQYPEEIRPSISCRPGHTLLAADYSQLEARILAILAGDDTSLDAFRRGKDCHDQNAQDLFGLAECEWEALGSESKPYRGYAKSFLYGICLDGDTPIATLGPERSKPISNIRQGDWVWSWAEGGYYPSQVKRWWNRGQKECVKVTVRDRVGNFKEVICTPDHQFLMRNGVYLQAKDLIPGQSLMPFRRFKSANYYQVDRYNNGSRQYEHRVVQDCLEQWGTARPHVHHINGDRHDNRPENLETYSSNAAHRRQHQGYSQNLSDEQREAKREHGRRTINHEKMAEGRRNSPTWQKAIREKVQPLGAKARRKNHVVVSVKPVGLREVYDIEVDGPAPNFAIAGAVFVHNSYGGAADTMKGKTFCPCPRCADKVPQTVNLTRPQVGAAAERWFAAHPAVRRWQSDLIQVVSRCHYYESPFGLRRYVSQPWGSEFEREVKNIPMQMNGALLMNRCQVLLDRLGAPIVFQHHDSFLLEVPEADAPRWATTVRGIMEDPVPELGGHSFPVDIQVGRNWGTRSEENPEGLHDV